MFEYLKKSGWSSENIEQLEDSQTENSDEIFENLIKSINDPYKKSQAWYIRSGFPGISEEKKEEYLNQAFEPLYWLSQNVLDNKINNHEEKYTKYLKKRKSMPLFYNVETDINFSYKTVEKYIPHSAIES